jgi:hypothetical protein
MPTMDVLSIILVVAFFAAFLLLVEGADRI